MCGIFGLYSKNCSSANISAVIKGLELLQHRGKDGCGISYIKENNQHQLFKTLGNVKEAFKNYKNKDKTKICIGHCKYSTSGKSMSKNIKNADKINELQPLVSNKNKPISIVHNGNIPNIKQHDTKFLLNILLRENQDFEQNLIYMMNNIPAAFCLLIITSNNLYVVRDRYGIRPLCVAEKNDCFFISSETCALDCENIREVLPGEILRINNNGLKTIYKYPKSINALCAFELFYFMNPKSKIKNNSIGNIRKNLGKKLANNEKLIKKESDYIVVGVPRSGIISAKAFAEHLSLQYIQLIQKVNDCTNGEDRTFILINNEARIKACKKKFKYSNKNIIGKKLIIIDDTIVRGNVIKTIIDSLKKCGATEIHLRIPSPPVIDICQLGIAIQNKEELIMYNRTINKVKNILKVDSLNYLSLKDLEMFPKYSYKQCFGGGIPKEIISVKEYNFCKN